MLVTQASVGGAAVAQPRQDVDGQISPQVVNFAASELIPANVPDAELFIVVGTKEVTGGEMKILVNDESSDNDGDGLGPSFEGALSTCDNKTSVLSSGWDCNESSPIDSDGDGVEDDKEIFGLYTAQEVLPFAWMGADPGRKDVFIEHDWDSNFDNALNGQNSPFTLIANTFARRVSILDKTEQKGMNPDGSYGLFMHVDVLGSPGTSVGDRLTSFDLGGSNALPNPVGSSASAKTQYDAGQISNVRKPYFRYQVLGRAAGNDDPGQASRGGSWGYYKTNAGISSGNLSVHELGHNLGLGHGGSFSVQNFKYNYYSLMSYRHQNRSFIGFSTDSGEVLNPRNLCEADGLNGSSNAGLIEYLSSSGAYAGQTSSGRRGAGFLVSNGGVDWNRDGIISDCSRPVQYALQRGDGRNISNTKQLDVDTIDLTPGDLESSESIAFRPGPNAELMISTIEGGEVTIRTAPYDGDCTNANEGNTVCVTWSAPTQTGIFGTSASTIFANGKLWVFVEDQGELDVWNGVDAANLSFQQTLFIGSVLERPTIIEDGGNLRVFFRDTSLQVFSHEMPLATEVWSPSGAQVIVLDGQSNLTSAAPVTVAKIGQSHLVLQFTSNTDLISFTEELSGAWVTSETYGTTWSGSDFSTTAAVGLVWRPDHIARPADTGYLILIVADAQGELYHIMHRGLGGDGVDRFERFELDEFIAYGESGGAAYFPAGGQNAVGLVRTARPSTSGPPIVTLKFLPKLDGIHKALVDATDDYALMSYCVGRVPSCPYADLLPANAGVDDGPGDVTCAVE